VKYISADDEQTAQYLPGWNYTYTNYTYFLNCKTVNDIQVVKLKNM